MRNSVLVYVARVEPLMVDSAAVRALAELRSLVLCIRGGTIGPAGASSARRNAFRGLVSRERTRLAPGSRQA